MRLGDITAVVSGGASGLGLCVAHALHAAGARVTVFDVNEAALAALPSAEGWLGQHCDVTSAESAERAFARSRELNGPERLLVNCAGIAPAARIVGKQGAMPLDDFERVIAINLVGSFNMLRLSAAGMRQLPADDQGERGLVVLTASIAAYEGQIGQSAYAASKAGVVGLVLPAARELASAGIRVCGVAPGVFETPMLLAMPDDVRASLGAAVPFPSRLGRPEEFADLVCHLAGNRMINGEVIRIDGAHRMTPR